MSYLLRAAVTALGLFGLTSTAHAATLEIDGRVSSVDAIQTFGTCGPTVCDVEIALDPTFPTPEEFELIEGASTTLDFVDITVTNTDPSVNTDFDLTATLSYTVFDGADDIEVLTEFTGTLFWRSGLVFVNWDNDTTVYEAFGMKYTVDLSDDWVFSPTGLISDVTLNSSATISVLTVPLPASGAVLLTGLGALALMRRRRRRT